MMFIQVTEDVVVNLTQVACVHENPATIGRGPTFLTVVMVGGYEFELEGWDLKKWMSLLMQANLQYNVQSNVNGGSLLK